MHFKNLYLKETLIKLIQRLKFTFDINYWLMNSKKRYLNSEINKK